MRSFNWVIDQVPPSAGCWSGLHGSVPPRAGPDALPAGPGLLLGNLRVERCADRAGVGGTCPALLWGLRCLMDMLDACQACYPAARCSLGVPAAGG